MGLPADTDKDRVKLCATWIDVEINLTLFLAYQNVDIKALFSSPSVKDQFVSFAHFSVQVTNFEINKFFVLDN